MKENIMPTKLKFQENNTNTISGDTYIHTSMVSHRGTVVSFGMNEAGKIKYVVLDLSAEKASKIDKEYWTNASELQFPKELSQFGYGVVPNDQMPLRDEKGDTLSDEDDESKADPFYSSTAKLSAKAPFQVFSDGKYIYLFRQALPGTDTNVDKVNSNSPVVNSTLLVDRFILSGTVLKLSREIRYQRSRHKTQPASRKDTLSPVDMDKNPFYEPTTELNFVQNLSEGGFSVQLIPTQETEVKRWQFFFYDTVSKKINSVSMRANSDGWFDTTDSQEFVDQFASDKELDSSFIDKIHSTIRDGVTDDNIASALKTDSAFQSKLRALNKDEIAEVVFAVRTGVVKDDFAIAENYGVTTGLSSIYYYQQEADKSGKPMKNKASVMLAMGLKKPDDDKHYLGVLNFAVSNEGKLSRLSKESLQLSELDATSTDKTTLLEEMRALEADNVAIRKEIEESRKAYKAQKDDLKNWSHPKAKSITSLMLPSLLSDEKRIKDCTANLASVNVAIGEANNLNNQYGRAISELNLLENLENDECDYFRDDLLDCLKKKAIFRAGEKLEGVLSHLKKVKKTLEIAQDKESELNYCEKRVQEYAREINKYEMDRINSLKKEINGLKKEINGLKKEVATSLNGKALSIQLADSRQHSIASVSYKLELRVEYALKDDKIKLDNTDDVSRYRLVLHILHNELDRVKQNFGRVKKHRFIVKKMYQVYQERFLDSFFLQKRTLIKDDRPTLRKLQNIVSETILPFYRDKIKPLLEELNENQIQLNEKQKSLKTGISSVKMPLIEIDGNGLATSGGLLKFAYTADKPFLFDDSLGRVSLYFRGENNNFFAAYFHPNIAQTITSKPPEQSELSFKPRLTLDMNVELTTTIDGNSCSLTIKDTQNSKTVEKWEALPLNSKKVAAILNGNGSFALGYLSQYFQKETSVLTIACSADNEFIPTQNLSGFEAENGVQQVLPTFLDKNRTLLIGNKQFSIAPSSKVTVKAGKIFKKNLAGIVKDAAHIDTIWTLLKTKEIIQESSNTIGTFISKSVFDANPDEAIKTALGLSNEISYAENDLVKLLKKAASKREISFQVTDNNASAVDFLNTGLDVQVMYDYSNYSRYPKNLTGISIDTWQHNRSFLFHATSTSSMKMQDFKTPKTYTITNAMGQWEAYDPGLAISFDRALEVENGLGKFGLLTTSDTNKLAKLQPTSQGLSMEAWINPREISAGQDKSRIICYQNGEHSYSLGFKKAGSQYKCFATIEDKEVVVNAAYDFNCWRHLAVTYKKYWGLELTNTFVNCGHDTSLSLEGEFAIELLVKFGGGSDGTLLCKENEYCIKAQSKRIAFTIGTTNVVAKNALSIDSNTFHKITVIRSKAKPQDFTSKQDYPLTNQEATGTGDKWYEGKKSDEILKGMAEQQDKMVESSQFAQSNLFGTPDQDQQDSDNKYYYGLIIDKEPYTSDQQEIGQIKTSFSNLQIGSTDFSGTFAEVRIWNRALSMHEAKQLKIAENNQSLLAWWRMSEGDGKYLYDNAGQNHGVVEEPSKSKWVDSPNTQLPRFNFYIDGKSEKIEVKASENTIITNQLSLGGYKQDTQYHDHFDGTLEEIRIWGVPRSEEEISDNAFGRLKGEREKLLANYTFDTNFSEIKKAALADIDGITEKEAEEIWSKLLAEDIITVDGVLTEFLKGEKLLLCLPLNGNAQDVSGNNHHGTVHDATLTTDRFGNADSAYQFSGNAYIRFTNSPISGTGDFSLVVFVKTTSTENIWIMQQRSPGIEGEYWLGINNGKPYYEEYRGGLGLKLESNNTINDGKWHQIVFVRNSSLGKGFIYIDGQKTDEATGTIKHINNELKFAIGVDFRHDKRYYFTGSLDDIYIFNDALSLEDVRKLYKVLTDQLFAKWFRFSDSTSTDGRKLYNVLTVIESPPQIKDLSYNSVTLTVEGHVWSGQLGKENITQVLSTAPISAEIPAVRSALWGVKTDYNDNISSCPAVVEYGEVQKNDDGTMNGILKRCYSYIKDQQWCLVTGYKVGNLVTEWYSQAQFAPQVFGFIEGAPPVPGENFPITKDSDIDIYAYKLNNSVEFEEAEEVSYNYTTSKEAGYQVTAESEMKLGTGTSFLIAPLGFGMSFEVEAGLATASNWETAGNRSQSFERGVETNTERSLSASLAGYDNGESGKNRYYKLGNTGYALVKSKTADIYLLRLAHNNALVSIVWQPNPDIPEDTNIISFPINPLYIKQGTLDGKFGDKPDEHYPLAQAAYGEYSYYKPKPAYKLKKRIEKEQQQIKAYYESAYDTSKTNALFNKLASITGAAQLIGIFPGFGAILTSLFNQIGGQIATQGAYDNSKIKEDLAKVVSQRNLVNTYVWTVEGGFFVESAQVTEMQQETYANDTTLSLSGGLGVAFDAEAGVMFEQKTLFSSGSSLTMTKSKTKESSKSFSLNVSVELPTSPRYQYVGTTMQKGLINAGTVDAYRFMSFYLEPQAKNYFDLFTEVIDPKWLEESPDNNAKALRQARNNDKQPPCWRIMHRVTYVSRILPEFDPEAPPSLENLMKVKNIESNYQLIKLFEPYVKYLTEPDAFFTKIDDIIDNKLPEFAEYKEEIKAYLALYYDID